MTSSQITAQTHPLTAWAGWSLTHPRHPHCRNWQPPCTHNRQKTQQFSGGEIILLKRRGGYLPSRACSVILRHRCSMWRSLAEFTTECDIPLLIKWRPWPGCMGSVSKGGEAGAPAGNQCKYESKYKQNDKMHLDSLAIWHEKEKESCKALRKGFEGVERKRERENSQCMHSSTGSMVIRAHYQRKPTAQATINSRRPRSMT